MSQHHLGCFLKDAHGAGGRRRDTGSGSRLAWPGAPS